jgi:predicted ester cyclase
MSVEQVARDFIAKMDDPSKTLSYLAPDAVAAGGVLPQPMPAKEAFKMMDALKIAFPDLKFDVQNVQVQGNQATVHAMWGGTHKGPLNLPMPGMQSVPPTGKKVSVKDTYIITVQGDKVTRIEVNSPPNGGMPGMLDQIGVKVVGM